MYHKDPYITYMAVIILFIISSTPRDSGILINPTFFCAKNTHRIEEYPAASWRESPPLRILLIYIHSHSPQQATGNAHAFSVHINCF